MTDIEFNTDGEAASLYLTVRGLRLHARRWAHPTPRLRLLIVHGYAEHLGYWAGLAEILQRRLSADVLAVDLPGHGRSDGDPGLVETIDEVASLIAEVVLRYAATAGEHLPTVLMGHSLGGLVATRAAQLHPGLVDLLVLHAPGVVPPDLLPPPEVLNDPDSNAMTRDPGLAEVIASDPHRVRGPMLDATHRAIADGARLALATDPLGALPVVWMHGTEDAILPYDEARLSFARLGAWRGVFLAYAGRGHGGMLEDAADTLVDDLVGAVNFLCP